MRIDDRARRFRVLTAVLYSAKRCAFFSSSFLDLILGVRQTYEFASVPSLLLIILGRIQSKCGEEEKHAQSAKQPKKKKRTDVVKNAGTKVTCCLQTQSSLTLVCR